MIPDPGGKTETPENDPEQLTRLLEIELIQKRAAWARESARYTKIRAAGLLFLFVIVIGSLLAFYLMYSTASDQRPGQPARSGTTSPP